MSRKHFALAATVATATVASVVTGVLAAPATAATAFTASVFEATHNSYSGNVDGSKNSITYQLDHGVRFVEFDIHDNGYATNHDYSVGHSSPGDLVDHSGGNPSSNLLHDWLNVVSAWSGAHPTAAPIVMMVDLKDDLTDNDNYAAGNLTALNQELRTAFGAKLLQAKDYLSGSTVDSLRGRVLPLISGDEGTRAEYRRDTGYHPAVAVNGHGQVVEVHDSGAGALWYWTGTYGSDGRVTWQRHGKFDSGTTPAVALNDNGDLVEVHQSQGATTLWYHVGHLGSDGDITWPASHQYDSGVLPTVAFTGTNTLREIHQSQGSSQNWTWQGTLGANTVTWTGNAKTSDPRYDKTTGVHGTERVPSPPARTAARPRRPCGWRPTGWRRAHPVPADGVRRVPERRPCGDAARRPVLRRARDGQVVHRLGAPVRPPGARLGLRLRRPRHQPAGELPGLEHAVCVLVPDDDHERGSCSVAVATERNGVIVAWPSASSAASVPGSRSPSTTTLPTSITPSRSSVTLACTRP